MEADQPADAVAVDERAVVVTPGSLLQGVEHSPVGGELVEPLGQGQSVGRAEEGQEHAAHLDGVVIGTGIRAGELDEPAQLPVRDRIARAVMTPCCGVVEQLQVTPEHALVVMERLCGVAGEQQVRDQSAHAASVSATVEVLQVDAHQHGLRLQHETELGVHPALDEPCELGDLCRRRTTPVGQGERVLRRHRCA